MLKYFPAGPSRLRVDTRLAWRAAARLSSPVTADRIRRAIGCLAAATMLAGCGPKGDELLARAEKNIAAGEYRAAMIDLRNYVSDHPDDARARAMLGLAMLEMGDAQAAETELGKAKDLGAGRELTIVAECRLLVDQDAYERVIEQCVSTGNSALDADLAVSRGDALLGLKRFQEARTSFDEALELRPGDMSAIQGIAAAAFATDGIVAARAVFDSAPQSAKKQPRLWLAQGSLEMRSGNFAEAEESYSMAVQRTGDDPDNRDRLSALAGLAEAQLRQGKTTEAAQSSQMLLEAAPKSAYAKVLRAQSAASAGDLQTARALLEEAVSADPGNLQARTVLGAVNFQQGNYGQAEMHLANVVAKEPNNLQAQRLLAQVRNQVQSPEQTLEALKPSLQKSSGDAGLLTLASRLSLQSGNKDEALDYLAQASAAASENSPQAQLDVAAVYLAAGDTDKAVEILESIPQQDNQSSVQRETLLLSALLRQGKADEAIARAEALSAQAPEDPAARTLAGAVFAATKRNDQARSEFEAVLRLRPGDSATYLNIARLDINEGDPVAASQQLQKALDSDPDNLGATLGMAAVAQAQRDSEGTERWLQKALTDHPDALPARLASSQFYLSNRDFGQAKVEADAAVALAPENSVALNLRGLARLGGGDLPGAIESFQSAISHAPRQPVYRLNLARAYALQRRPQDALDVIDEALAVVPDNSSALAIGAVVAMQAGDMTKAVAYVDKVQRIAPGATATLMLEGDLAMAQKQYKKAVGLYEKAAESGLSRNLTLARYRAARLAESKEAQKALEEWLERQPEDAAVRVLLAEYLVNEGQNSAGKFEYERVLASDPANVVALNNLALLYQQAGDDRALPTAEKAYKAAPNSAAVQDTYGWVLVENGRTDEGLRHLRDAAEVLKDSPEVQYHLAVALAGTGDTGTASLLLSKIVASDGSPSLKADAKRALADIGNK